MMRLVPKCRNDTSQHLRKTFLIVGVSSLHLKNGLRKLFVKGIPDKIFTNESLSGHSLFSNSIFQDQSRLVYRAIKVLRCHKDVRAPSSQLVIFYEIFNCRFQLQPSGR